MPLLPSATYSAWFKKTSPVYRAFAFLFQNPLWDKSVPNGFSLCPFAWLALFSAAIFRPLVYALLGVHAVIKVLNLTRVIRFVDRLVLKVFSCGDTPPIAVPTIVGLMITLLGATILTLILAFAVSCWQVGVFGAFLLPLILLTAFVACLVYADRNNHKSDRCHVETYVHVLSILYLIAAWVFHPTEAYSVFIGAPIATVAAIGHAFASAAVAIWDVFTFSVVWCAEGIWAARGIVLSSVIGLGLAAIWGWAALRFSPTTKREVKEDNISPEDLRQYRLKVLAQSMWEEDRVSGRHRKWWLRFLLKCDAALDTYLSGSNWDAEAIQQKLWPEMRAKADKQWADEVRRQQVYDARCQKVSDTLAAIVAPIVTVVKQVGIACSYLWALIKAKKGGVCPYIRFQD